MSFEQAITEILESFNTGFSQEDKIKLRESAQRAGLQNWKWRHRGQAMLVGGASGLILAKDLVTGSTVMVADLSALLLLSARASFGIGHIIDKNEVNHNKDDIMGILALWTGIADAVTLVPTGKVGIKLTAKPVSKVIIPLGAQLASKAIVKTHGKIAGKLASKVGTKIATKIATKLAAKESVKAVSQAAPWIGGIASLSVNLWIINGIMDAAEKYYSNPYLAVDDDLGGLAPA